MIVNRKRRLCADANRRHEDGGRARCDDQKATAEANDIIALLEADDLDLLGRAVSESIQVIEGVGRTTTCLVMRL